MTGSGITLIPRSYINYAYMNSTNTTEGGYANSYMHTTLLPNIASALQNVLGSHLVNRRILISDVVENGKSTGWGWYSTCCSLLSEIQIYGSNILGNFVDIGEACQKLPIFNFINFNANSRSHFWLRAVAGTASFASANSEGCSASAVASSVRGVRPLIYIS